MCCARSACRTRWRTPRSGSVSALHDRGRGRFRRRRAGRRRFPAARRARDDAGGSGSYINRKRYRYASERENSFDGDGAQTGFVGDRRGGRAHPGAARQTRQAVGRRARRRAGARLLRPQLHARIRRREGQVRRNRRGQGRDGAGRSESRHVHPRHRDGLCRGEAAIRLCLPQSERKRPLRLRRSRFTSNVHEEARASRPHFSGDAGRRLAVRRSASRETFPDRGAGRLAFRPGRAGNGGRPLCRRRAGRGGGRGRRQPGHAVRPRGVRERPADPAAQRPAEAWQSLFEGARLRAERALARPVTHAVLAVPSNLQPAAVERLVGARSAAGLECCASSGATTCRPARRRRWPPRCWPRTSRRARG